ncbi:hypothetical protein O4214_14355 [Rhodococcus erythropolis]|uniref:hypothetical protein n=1 Tax=Rhodococcus erythropolis TaxID=1833 RepID=UPI001E5EBD04|nr:MULTISPECIES: hypothetical protein [Rhodococcus erythropolis group]MCD2104704.1 hypothetical protein [Rhodococcus qingshengii]MCZ4525170.1 hypothetical protein [Rhodococcus erythropolis]
MSGRTAHESNRRREQWTWRDGLVIVSIVALGTVVAAVMNEDTGTSIPGCDSVESPGPPVRFNYGFAGEPGYDDPDYPWFSGPKATAMSDALLESLPSDVEAVFASPSKSFEFAPIQNFRGASFPDGVDPIEFSGSTKATGAVSRGGQTADVSVQVRAWDQPVPPCLEGLVDRREHLANGTVLDIADFEDKVASDVGGERGVVAYLGDGSRVVASIDTSTDTGPLLTMDELIALATAPGLAVTAPVPDSTPPPMASCYTDSVNAGPPATRMDIDRLNQLLDARWKDLGAAGVTLERPLGSLVPDDYGQGGVCERIVASTADGSSDVEISVGTAVPEPGETLTLPDSTIVTRLVDPYGSGDDTVRVVHPSGETVVVTQFVKSAGSTKASPLTIEQLEFIATTPGLMLSVQ